MNKGLTITVVAVAVVVVAALVFGTAVFAMAPWQQGYWGMRGQSRDGFGPGMGGMMGGYGGYWPDGGQAISIDEATEAVEGYLVRIGNPDLKVVEVMEFSENFYAEVEEESTGIHAFELLVDKYTSEVYPEPGPNMMWNTKYGHMGGGSMHGFDRPYAAPMSVDEDEARDYAQRYLDRYFPGTVVGEADAFYGYYTLHTMRDGKVTGMLSVNGSSGSVWYHSWHGPFVQMIEVEG